MTPKQPNFFMTMGIKIQWVFEFQNLGFEGTYFGKSVDVFSPLILALKQILA